MRKIALAVLLAMPLMLSACNTISGIGKDIGAAGNAVSDSAEKTKNKN
jgi:predicted small secreted protein